jgi:hypothetical protein
MTMSKWDKRMKYIRRRLLNGPVTLEVRRSRGGLVWIGTDPMDPQEGYLEAPWSLHPELLLPLIKGTKSYSELISEVEGALHIRERAPGIYELTPEERLTLLGIIEKYAASPE